MKKYIQPEVVNLNVDIQTVLAATSLTVNDAEVDGSQALSKQLDDEWVDEPDF